MYISTNFMFIVYKAHCEESSEDFKESPSR